MNSSGYLRGQVREHLRIVNSKGSEQLIPVSSVYQDLGVSLVIRVSQNEYPDETFIGKAFTHFGLPIHDDPAGTVAVVARIIENGYFLNFEDDKPPLLSLDNVWRVEVLECVPSIPLDSIPSEYFKLTIGLIRDVESLKKVLVERYKNVLKGKTEEEILAQGVSIRFLKIVGDKISYGGN